MQVKKMLVCAGAGVGLTLTAQAGDLFWDANGVAAGFGGGVGGVWGAGASWTQDDTGAFTTPIGGVLTTTPADRLVINKDGIAPGEVLQVQGDQSARGIFNPNGNSSADVTINAHANGGRVLLYGVGLAEPIIQSAGNDGQVFINAPIVLKQAANSDVYIGGSPQGGINGSYEINGGLASDNPVNLIYARQHSMVLDGDLSGFSGTITNAQSQPGNATKRRSLEIRTAIGSGVTDLTMSGGDSAFLILAAPDNAYTGKTTVHSGTLSTLTDTSLPDTTGLFLTDDLVSVGNDYGTKVDLNFSGTNTISALFFNGVPQASGTWGSSSSSATHTNDTWFAGSGMLLVSPARTPGDTDGDGDIDDTDLGTSFANYTGPIGAAGGKTAAHGDGDADGDVDDSDLGTSFAGYTGPLATASIPEPTSIAWLGLGCVLVARRRRPRPCCR